MREVGGLWLAPSAKVAPFAHRNVGWKACPFDIWLDKHTVWGHAYFASGCAIHMIEVHAEPLASKTRGMLGLYFFITFLVLLFFGGE